jgi:MFS family permease
MLLVANYGKLGQAAKSGQCRANSRLLGDYQRMGDSLKEAYFRRFSWILLSLIGSVEFVRGAMFLALVPIFVPHLADPVYIHHHFRITVFLSGAIISAMYGADTIAKPSSGWLVDYFGPRRTLLFSLPLALLGLSTFLWSRSGPVLLLGAILFGLGCSPVWPAVVSTLVEHSPSDEQAGTLSSVFVAWMLGMGSGYVLINLLFHLGPKLLITVLLGIFCIPLLLAFNTRKWLSRKHANTVSGPRRHLIQMIREVWNLRMLMTGSFAQTLATSMLIPLLIPFFGVVYGLDQTAYGLLILVVGAITIAIMVPVGKMVDRLGYRLFLVTGCFLAGVLMLAISGYPKPLLLYPYAILFGISYALILPSWNGLLAHMMPSSVRGSLYSIFMSIDGLGMALGPVIGGKLGDTYGFRFTFGVSATILFAMAVFYLLLLGRRTRDNTSRA